MWRAVGLSAMSARPDNAFLLKVGCMEFTEIPGRRSVMRICIRGQRGDSRDQGTRVSSLTVALIATTHARHKKRYRYIW